MLFNVSRRKRGKSRSMMRTSMLANHKIFLSFQYKDEYHFYPNSSLYRRALQFDEIFHAKMSERLGLGLILIR